MPRRLPLLLKVLFSIAIGYPFLVYGQAPVPIPITGNLGSIIGFGQPYAGMSIQLVNCPSPAVITGYYGLVQTGYQLQANSAGLINSTIWPNDKITCNGTTGTSQYSVTYMVNGQPTGPAACYQPVSSIGTWNINTLQPIACTLTPPNPQDQTWRNLTLTGFLQGNGADFTGRVEMASILLDTAPGSCSGSNIVTGLSATLGLICSSLPVGVSSFNTRTGAVVPATGDYTYLQISGTPTLNYQTVDANGVAQTQRPAVDFTPRFAVADSVSPAKTVVDLATVVTAATCNYPSSIIYDVYGRVTGCTSAGSTTPVAKTCTGTVGTPPWQCYSVAADGTIHDWGTITISFSAATLATGSITFSNTAHPFTVSPEMTVSIADMVDTSSGSPFAQTAYYYGLSITGATAVARCSVDIGGSGCSNVTTTVPFHFDAWGQ